MNLNRTLVIFVIYISQLPLSLNSNYFWAVKTQRSSMLVLDDSNFASTQLQCTLLCGQDKLYQDTFTCGAVRYLPYTYKILKD